MERAERIIAIAFGLLFSAALVPILAAMVVLTAVTAVQRFVVVWRQASAPRAAPAHQSAAGRWRAWRASMEARPSRASRRTASGTTAPRWQTRRARAGTAPAGSPWRRRHDTRP